MAAPEWEFSFPLLHYRVIFYLCTDGGKKIIKLKFKLIYWAYEANVNR